MLSKSRQEEEINKLDLLRQHFEWIRVLGEGTFGKVYLIRNKVTKKEYALKQYNRAQLQKHNKYKSLIRSLYILQSLTHPNIIRCVNYILPPEEDLAIYTIFQSCKRGSLDNIKKHLRVQKMDNLIKLVLYDLGQALKYLKSQKVAHRDIKPSNITFNSEGELKIIDFDEAVCFDQKLPNVAQFKLLRDFGINLSDAHPFARPLQSRASNYVGTLFYMAPEMVQSTICDEKSDLWAFGCIIYELIVGQFLHIQFDGPELFQEELALRLKSFAQATSDPLLVDLFRSIATYHPEQRIDIQQALLHPFFEDLRDELKRSLCRQRLVRFLRGNFNISKDRSYDIYGIQGLNLNRGSEVYRELKTVVLVIWGQGFKFYEIISGPFYFKFKECKNETQQDFYIRYDKIDRISKQKDLLTIYYFSDPTEEILQTKSFKHFYPQSLDNLHRLMEIIIRE